uniref:Uncharacterized protein n=1 Tax=Medicago truncatula TaxID=3880 RepID=I3S4K1_MEDTR|nr:unknown [Medicago truncatula]
MNMQLFWSLDEQLVVRLIIDSAENTKCVTSNSYLIHNFLHFFWIENGTRALFNEHQKKTIEKVTQPSTK